ncbi:response regulator transcription factor [Nonomuraea sp. NPDC050328]|uniref:response regulator transcription factor n=1 Tax=Nonomuraea sp. NPDC050328 TaxID=3364361 RepID=UPI003799C3F9
MIRVLLVDDQALVRGALAAPLNLERDLEVVGQAGSATEAIDAARAARPDVVLLDIQMAGGDLTRAMAAGAAGFVLKDIKPERLADTVRKGSCRAACRGPRSGRRVAEHGYQPAHHPGGRGPGCRR